MAYAIVCRNCGWRKPIQRRSPDDLRLCPRCTSRTHYVDEEGRLWIYLSIAAMVVLVILGLLCLPLSCIVAGVVGGRR